MSDLDIFEPVVRVSWTKVYQIAMRCPHCGGRPNVVDEKNDDTDTLYYIECSARSTAQPGSIQNALRAWNRREAK